MRIENGLDDSDGADVTGVKLSGPGAAPWSNSDICQHRAGTFTLNKGRTPPPPLPSRQFVYQRSHAWKGAKEEKKSEGDPPFSKKKKKIAEEDFWGKKKKK